MFSGIGGFELGIGTKADCVGFSEIDKYAIQIYKKHFGGHKNYGNATTINPETIPDFDLFVGGFPCQAFSVAGKRRGFEDTRGTLFFDIAKILKVKQPRLFVLENVKGLLNHDRGETFTKILQTIDELGYDVQWQVLNSKHFGVPQNRERVFIIGHLRGTSRPKVFPIRRDEKEDIKGLPKRYYSSTITTRVGSTAKQQPWIHPTLTGAIGRQSSSKEYISSCKVVAHSLFPRSGNPKQGGTGHLKKEDGTTYCVDTGNCQGVEIGKMIRRLTPVECERLQGFPDNWTKELSDTQRYKCCGNAVTVNVIKAIMERLL